MEIPTKLIEKGVSVKDLKILEELIKGDIFDNIEKEIVSEIAKKTNISEKEVSDRLKKLRKNGIINKIGGIVDPLNVWNNVYFTLVKISLTPPVLGLETKYPRSWKEIGESLQKFVEGDDLAKKLIRQAYTLVGTEWDVLLVITANDPTEHIDLLEKLVEKGYVDRAWSFSPIKGVSHVFDPISVPSVESVKDALKRTKEYMEKG